MRRLILLMTASLLTLGLGTALAAAETVAFTPVQDGPGAPAQAVERYAPDRLLVQFASGKVPAELDRKSTV